MTLEQQVTNLQISKRLKELGVKQDAYWTWYVNSGKGELMHNPFGMRGFDEKSFDAFTVAELGEMLPEKIEGYMSLQTGPYLGSWVVQYQRIGYQFQSYRFEEDTEANARGKMLIYLLENKLI